MATMQFTADVNKTVTIDGILYTLTVPVIPDNLKVYLNEVQLNAGEVVTLSDNMSITFEVEPQEPSKVTVNHVNTTTANFNGNPITNGQILNISGENNTLDFIGSTSIPQVQINGDGINTFAVNGFEYNPDTLPFTFTPLGGITNSVFVNGNESEIRTISISGTDIETMTVNNIDTPLPFTTRVDEDLIIAISGRIYQIDLSSIGGAVIKQDDIIISDGNTPLHRILDIDKDTYIEVDGTHTMLVDGNYIKSIILNGVSVPITNLPMTLKNIVMSGSLIVNGFDPSEVHISGHYINTATIDGKSIPVDDHGDIDIEFETVSDNHFITIVGAQPREYGITWDDNGTTTLEMDGKKQESGTKTLISKDVFVEAFPQDIPINIESDDDVTIQINGRRQSSHNFTFYVSQETELDITTETCRVTIDYIDASFNMILPQGIVTIAAPHRDGWIFDNWSSSTIGIHNPKSVRTTIDLTGHSTAQITAHYQKGLTLNKPNHWN